MEFLSKLFINANLEKNIILVFCYWGKFDLCDLGEGGRRKEKEDWSNLWRLKTGGAGGDKDRLAMLQIVPLYLTRA